MNYATAQQECSKLTTDGGGWRLCSVAELQSDVCCKTGEEDFKNQWNEAAFTDSAQCLSDKHYTWTLEAALVLGYKQTASAMCSDAISLNANYVATNPSIQFYDNKQYTAAQCMVKCQARVTGTSAFYLQTLEKGELVSRCGCSLTTFGACPLSAAPTGDYCAANHYIAYEISDPASVSTGTEQYLTARGNRAFAADSPTGRHWQGGTSNCPFKQILGAPTSLSALVPTIPCGMPDCATYPSDACNRRVSNYCIKIKEVSEADTASLLPAAAADLIIQPATAGAVAGAVGACMEWNTVITAAQGTVHQSITLSPTPPPPTVTVPTPPPTIDPAAMGGR